MKHAFRSAATALGVAISLASVSAYATNGYQLSGIGSYQKSLGGAVTANPNTAMTAISNPAGMARVGTRADFSMEAFMPDRHVDFTEVGGAREDSAATLYGIPALGWTAPISDDNGHMYFGGGMYGTSGLGVDYASTLFLPVTPGGPMYFDGFSSIAFWQMAPTLAWNASPRMSLGVSLNMDYQSVAFKQRYMLDTNSDGHADTTAINFDLSRAAQGIGFGISVGVLFDVNERVTVGASYKSKQEFADMEYQLARGDIKNMPTAVGCESVGLDVVCPEGTYKLRLDFPQQLAAGIAVQAAPKLKVSADVKWIDWSSTMDELAISGPGSVKVSLPAGWEDQVIYALGVGFAASDRLNLRAGVNYAKAPIDDADVMSNLILPATVETHFAVGADYRVNKYWELGVHYMYAPEKNFTAPASDPMGPGTEIGLSESSFGVNLGTRF